MIYLIWYFHCRGTGLLFKILSKELMRKQILHQEEEMQIKNNKKDF